MNIKYVKGNLFDLINHSSNVIIPHICNNVGKWGAGFVLALSKQWPKKLKEYSPEYVYGPGRSENHYGLGGVQYIQTLDGTTVVNMIAQCGTIGPKNRHPIKYDALDNCMKMISTHHRDYYGKEREYEIHAPMFGAGLAGGSWLVIEALIKEHWINRNIPVTIYQL